LKVETKPKEITDNDLDLIDKLLRAKQSALTAEREDVARELDRLLQQVKTSG